MELIQNMQTNKNTVFVLKSSDSSQYFQNNSGKSFTCLLDQPIEVYQNSKIGLREVLLSFSKGFPKKTVVIFDVLLKESAGCSDLSGNKTSILRRVFVPVKRGDEFVLSSYNMLDFIALRPGYIEKFQISIDLLFPEDIKLHDTLETYLTLEVRH